MPPPWYALQPLAGGTGFWLTTADTIKVRMQLSKRARAPGVRASYLTSVYHRGTDYRSQVKPRGFIKTGSEIIKKETPLGLYKGLGAVLTGIVPKMAIRFTSYEWYKQLLASKEGNLSGGGIFIGTQTMELDLDMRIQN